MASVEEVVQSCLEDKNFTIKKEQLLAIKNIIEGFDTLCILPSGFGKSLIYQLLPSVFLQLNQSPSSSFQPIGVVVLSPFLSNIEDQVKSANSSGFNLKATSLNSNLYHEISSGEFNIIFGTQDQNLGWKIRNGEICLPTLFFL